MDKITKLEFRITEYEKGQVKEKCFEDKSKTIIMQIEELNRLQQNKNPKAKSYVEKNNKHFF